MTPTKDPKSSWTKQCSHCFRLLREDGRYYDRGLTSAIASLPSERLRVLSSICPDCFAGLRESLSRPEKGGPYRAAVA